MNSGSQQGVCSILFWIVIAFLALIYLALPLWTRILVFIVNMFFPDPIPYLDEIFMIAGILGKIILFENFIEFYEENKGLVWAAAIFVTIACFFIIF